MTLFLRQCWNVLRMGSEAAAGYAISTMVYTVLLQGSFIMQKDGCRMKIRRCSEPAPKCP